MIGHSVRQYIERELQAIGSSAGRQEYSTDSKNDRNIEAMQSPRVHAEAATIVVGADHDSYGDALGSNDNATGTRRSSSWRASRNWRPERTRVQFVLFANEEPPYFRMSTREAVAALNESSR
jgi:hypothetical protein